MLIACMFFAGSQAQGIFRLPEGKKKIVVPVEIISNMVILPLQVNGLELSFLLDTGVKSNIIFNAGSHDDVYLNHTSTIYLTGAGSGEPVEALKSEHNILNIGEASAVNQNLYFITDAERNFSPRLGLEVNGIIGYELLKDLIVQVDYKRSKVILHDPETYKYKNCNSCATMDLSLSQGKPYVKLNVSQDGEALSEVKLLLDSGSGDAVWLFPESHEELTVGVPNFDDILGLGITGDVTGKRAKLPVLKIDDLKINDVTVAYPDTTSIKYLTMDDNRNGSLGGEVLRRFDVVYDYQNKKVTLKKNSFFKEPFRYNRSGLIVEHHGFDVIKEIAQVIKEPASVSDRETTLVNTVFSATNTIQFKLKNNYKIAEIRPGSSGEMAGLQKGDKILKINGRDTGRLKLKDITRHFFKEDGYTLKLKVERNGVVFNCKFALKKML